MDDKLLIDLSDDTEEIDASNLKHAAPSTLCLLDSLLSSNPSQYGNLELQKPLMDNKNDPFDITSAYRGSYSTGFPVAKQQADSPSKQRQPIVYSRTHSQDDKNKKSASLKTDSSGKSTSASTPPIPPRGVKSIPSQNFSVSAHMTEKGDAYYSLPPPEEGVSEKLCAYQNVPNYPDQAQIPHSSSVNVVKPCQSYGMSSLEKKKRYYPQTASDPKKSEKAFDWLNDAISSFAVSNSLRDGDVCKSSNFPLYDQVPDESEDSGIVNQTSCRPPPLYDEVPVEEDKYQTSSNKNVYMPQSDMDDNVSWDSFDSDFDDDNVDTGMAASAPLPIPVIPHDPDAPPLPPRDYLSSSLDSGRGTFRKKADKYRINPILQDGKQLSHTHYFLLAPKVDTHNNKPNTAEIKPFSVDGTQIDNHRTSIGSEYQNVPNLDLPGSRLSSASDDLSWMGITGMKAVDNNRRPSKCSAKSSYTQSVEKSRKVQNVEQMSTSPREKVFSVMNSVMGVTDEECHAALCHASWDTDCAIRFLKTEQLFRLGIASREKCEKLLDALNWNLELASSVLLDEVKSPFTVESQV